MKRPEQEFQKQVMRYLKIVAPECYAFSVPNGGYRRKSEAAILKGLGVKAGVSDIVLLWKPGMCAFVELKTPETRNRISPHQQAFLLRMGELSVPWAVCATLDEVERFLKNLEGCKGFPLIGSLT